jgi:NADH:ubiquinone oxidoreductase subunit 5 (subunit L)/multisubunit Na+/H+ antiporter MnhA subunit
MRAPTPISSLVHSRTLVTAGYFLLIYYKYIYYYINIILIFRIISIFFSGLISIFELDIKKIVALSTLRQISFCFSFYSIGLIFIRFFHLIRHSFFKRRLFIQIGFFIFNSFRNQLKNFLNLKNLSIFRFLINFICLIGLLFNSGFISKDFLILFFINLSFTLLIYFLCYFLLIFTFFYSIILLIIYYKKIIAININKLKSEIFNSNIIILISLFFRYFYFTNFSLFNNSFLNFETFFINFFLFFVIIIFILNKKLIIIFKLDYFLNNFNFSIKNIIILKLLYIFIDLLLIF